MRERGASIANPRFLGQANAGPYLSLLTGVSSTQNLTLASGYIFLSFLMPPKKSFAKKVPYSKERPAKRTKFADDISKVKVSNTKLSSLPAKVAAKPNSVVKGKQKERAPTPPPNRLLSTKAKPEKQPSTAANPKSTPLSPLPSAFKIVAGSYEKLLYGLEGTVSASSSEDLTFSLKPLFIFPAHVSCVKAVTASPQGGKWLATGSADEIIKVWDLRRRREIGGLMHHEGSSHLFVPGLCTGIKISV